MSGNFVGDIGVMDFFAGCGGSMQGLASVPGVFPVLAANHWAQALASHEANFPQAEHLRGDIRDLDVTGLPYAEFFWASPECPKWSQARGHKRDYDAASRQPGLIPDLEPLPVEADERSRALMWDVPRYLDGMQRRGRPVLVGVVENVVDVRAWDRWREWVASIENLGYRTRLIAVNSMHAVAGGLPLIPQSRDRLYLAYWHRSVRTPDWDKWLRPQAWCPGCQEWVAAVQSWKRAGLDMGRYRSQYVYRCPRVGCRNQVVEPAFAPAWTAIDWSLPGERIGDRKRPIAAKTRQRIAAGIRRYARPFTAVVAGNTFERRPGVRTWPVEAPLTTFTTTATHAVAAPPLLVPVEGREGVAARMVTRPLRTQTARGETAIVVTPPMLVPTGGSWNDTARPVSAPAPTFTTRESGAVVPPFVAELRGGGSQTRAVDQALATFTASGTHHALVLPGMVMRNNGSRGDGGEHCTSLADATRTITTKGHQSLVTWQAWAQLYRYDTGLLTGLDQALPTQTTRDGDALLAGIGLPEVDDCLLRMLQPHEIGSGMGFATTYIVLGTKTARTAQYGNAVTPGVSAVIAAALIEAVRGEDLEPAT